MRRYLAIVLLLTCLPALAIAGFNYVVDPVQYFRPARFYKPGIYTQERFLYPALIRHQPYDGVIIGTSTAMTIRPSLVNRAFGGQFLKLTMNGGRPSEQAMVLDAALKHSETPLRTVIWGIDPHMWVYPVNDRNQLYFFPEYLYKPDPLGVLRSYLLSRDITAMSWTSLYNHRYNQVPGIDLDNVGNWVEYFAQFKYACSAVETQVSKFVPRDARVPATPPPPEAVAQNGAVLNANFEQNLLPLIRANPQTQFYLYNPPYSRAEAFYLAAKAPGALEARQRFKERLEQLARENANIHYYDFEQWRDITDNLDNYYDYQHHSKAINDAMFEYMARHPGLATSGQWIEAMRGLSYQDVFKQCFPPEVEAARGTPRP